MLPGADIPDVDWETLRDKQVTPEEPELSKYTEVIGKRAKLWNDILTSKHKDDRKFFRRIDSMAMHLVFANLQGKKFIKTNALDSNCKPVAHNFPVRAIGSILQYLIDSPDSWFLEKSKNSVKDTKGRHENDDNDDNDDSDEDNAAESAWNARSVKHSTAITLMHWKLICKAMYKIIDWRAVAFAFQRYTSPMFIIQTDECWDCANYFRWYVLRKCLVPDWHAISKSCKALSFIGIQPLLHRYANFCYRRHRVRVLYTRNQVNITRRVIFVDHMPVAKNGQIASIALSAASKSKKRKWENVSHISQDLVERDGDIHVELQSYPKLTFRKESSGWSVMDQNIYAVLENETAFQGIRSKSFIDKLEIIAISDDIEAEDGVKKKTNSEDDEDEGEAGVENDLDGFIQYDQAAMAGAEEEGENYEEELDEEDIDHIKTLNVARGTTTRSSLCAVPQYVRTENAMEAIGAVPTKSSFKGGCKRKHDSPCGIFDLQRNDIDDLSDEEEYSFKTKKKK